MSTPQRRTRPPRRQAGLAVQLGQTLVVLGAAVLVVGLFLRGSTIAVWIGAVFAVVGVVLLLVGRRTRGRVPPA